MAGRSCAGWCCVHYGRSVLQASCLGQSDTPKSACVFASMHSELTSNDVHGMQLMARAAGAQAHSFRLTEWPWRAVILAASVMNQQVALHRSVACVPLWPLALQAGLNVMITTDCSSGCSYVMLAASTRCH